MVGYRKSIAFIVILVLMASWCSAATCQITASEGDLITLTPEAFDPDPEIGPAGELLWSFGAPFDENAQWQTVKGDAGIHLFYVQVSDGELTDTVRACAEVLPNNHDPIITEFNEVTIVRGQAAQISASCYDPDGDVVQLSFRFQGRDVAYIQYEPPGTYNLDVICTDGFGGMDTERTLLHIVMPDAPEDIEVRHTPWLPPEVPEPEKVDLRNEPVQEYVPEDVELRLPTECPAEPVDLQTLLPEDVTLETITPEQLELIYPAACRVEVVSPQPYQVEIVQPQPYDVDVIYPVQECGACPTCKPCPEPEPEAEESGCGGNSRKAQINRVLNQCCK